MYYKVNFHLKHNTNNNLELAQLTSPYIDAYHFYELIVQNTNINNASRQLASEVCEAIDQFVIYSYYGRGFLPNTEVFQDGKNGVYQIIPMGNKVFSQTNRSFWSHTTWFHPDDKSNEQNSYGLYDWCKDGASRGNDKIENFFENYIADYC